MMLKVLAKRIFQKLTISLSHVIKPSFYSLNGVKVNLNHENISNELKDVFYNQTYEKDEINILKSVLSPTDIVFEVGAGIGFLSTYCAKRLGSSRVFAYEANPKMIAKILETYSLNNTSASLTNAFLLNSPTEEFVDFYLADDFWSSSSIQRSSDFSKIKVRSLSLLDELKKISPSILIVDIEGGEKIFFEDLDLSLLTIKTIIVELHPHVISNKDCAHVIKCILKHDFYIDLTLSSNNVLCFMKS